MSDSLDPLDCSLLGSVHGILQAEYGSQKSLAALAAATEGVYIKYTTPAQVAEKVELAMRNLDRSRSAASARAGYKNRYQIPLSLAVLCLAGWILLPYRPKAVQKK